MCYWCYFVFFVFVGVLIFSFLSKILEIGEFDWKIFENDCRIKRDNWDWLSKNKFDCFSCVGLVWLLIFDILWLVVWIENLFFYIG